MESMSDVERSSDMYTVKLSDRPRDEELRILIFTACYFVLDGVTLTIRRLESYLRSRGAIVKVLSTVPDDFTEEQTRDIIVVPGIKIPFTQAGSGYAFGAGLGETTLREIEEFNPNCIHFTVPDLVSLDGIRWCQRNNVAHIATWHSNYCDYLKYYFLDWVLKPGFLKYLQGFYEQVPAVYVPTPFILNKMKDEGFGRLTTLHQWGRGVDMKLFSPERRSASFRAARGLSESDVVILWVGRLVPEKSPEIWMNVLERLQREGIPAKGLVVGHGCYEAELSQMSNIVCCGWLSGIALAEAYASSDIFLFPSDVETFGNVTLEALASGCVGIVEEKCGGHLVEHGINGYTCPALDEEHFYQATKSLVQGEQLRKRMSQQARQSAWKFERSKILQQMAENYKDAIVRHLDPTYIEKRIDSASEIGGRNIISIMCCNYWPIKNFAEPVLNTTTALQDYATATTDFIKKSRGLRSLEEWCGERSREEILESEWRNEEDIEEGRKSNFVRFDDERKDRVVPSSSTVVFLSKAVNYIAFTFSYIIIGLFVYASFTV